MWNQAGIAARDVLGPGAKREDVALAARLYVAGFKAGVAAARVDPAWTQTACAEVTRYAGATGGAAAAHAEMFAGLRSAHSMIAMAKAFESHPDADGPDA
jgi:hypothetical protein